MASAAAAYRAVAAAASSSRSFLPSACAAAAAFAAASVASASGGATSPVATTESSPFAAKTARCDAPSSSFAAAAAAAPLTRTESAPPPPPRRDVAFDEDATAAAAAASGVGGSRKGWTRRRMTSIGRFSLKSETLQNPSIPTFFLALSGKPITIPEFVRLWNDRRMPSLHPRFHSRVSSSDDRYFDHPRTAPPRDDAEDAEPVVEEDDVRRHASETLRFASYRSDLKMRIERMLTDVIDVTDKLWEVQLSSGPLGSSGAISRAKAEALTRDDAPPGEEVVAGEEESEESESESVLLFRAHHALADGVSLAASLSDLCDEAEEIRSTIRDELERRKRKRKSRTFLRRIARTLKLFLWFLFGSIRAMGYQGYLLLTASRSDPFATVHDLSLKAGDPTYGRSISWCDAAPLDEVKAVAKSVGRGVTVNDVFVSCVSRAVSRQIAEHRERFSAPDHDADDPIPTAKSIDVVVPVHLGGGILPPGASVGNNIGAFSVRVPGETTTEEGGRAASDRLRRVHDSLARVKGTPAPLLSYLMARFCSDVLPERLTKMIFSRAAGNACCVVSNARGSPKKLHLGGRAVESSAAFLPLPPGVPIGIVVNSYAGAVSLSVTTEKYAVPDADLFMSWILEEYCKLRDEVAPNKVEKA